MTITANRMPTTDVCVHYMMIILVYLFVYKRLMWERTSLGEHKTTHQLVPELPDANKCEFDERRWTQWSAGPSGRVKAKNPKHNPMVHADAVGVLKRIEFGHQLLPRTQSIHRVQDWVGGKREAASSGKQVGASELGPVLCGVCENSGGASKELRTY